MCHEETICVAIMRCDRLSASVTVGDVRTQRSCRDMTDFSTVFKAAALSVFCLLLDDAPGEADSTSPRLAAYYDLRLLICGQTAYQWRGTEQPRPAAENIVQVGVGRDTSYGLNTSGQLLAWADGLDEPREILDQVTWFAAGRTGLFAARVDGSLVYLARPKSWIGVGELIQPEKVAVSAIAASVGDSANYFVTNDGRLFVKGLAHRGQYGDGKLKSSDEFVSVASEVAAVKAHTGHAIMLKRDGTVMGTGGNIYGPLGRHGIGDKAIFWGPIFRNASAIATGSSHSLALQRDGSLWHWGKDVGLDPGKIMVNVAAAAADRSSSVALLNDNSLWQWERGRQPQKHFHCP